MNCPDLSRLLGFLELRLPPGEEIVVSSHVDGCAECDARLLELEPSWLFRRVPRRTLTPVAWDDVMRAVRVEVAANPRRMGAREQMFRWMALLWRPAALGLASLGVLLVTLSLLQPVSSPLISDKLEEAGDPVGFNYLSNPHAQVTHVVVADPDGAGPVALTMVVDDSLAGLF